MIGGSQIDLGLRVPAKARREGTRATNLRLVLQHLFSGAPLSRADLARATELTAATVSALVAELEEADLIEEVGPRRDVTQVGKPPTMLQVRADARHAIAVDLSDPAVARGAVVDLAGRFAARTEIATGGAIEDDALELVEQLIAETVALATSPILGIGIGTPGVVAKGTTVVEASNFGWHHVDLGTRIESSFGYTTHVRNDANAAAIAEFSRGGHDYHNLAVVKIGSGVGAGFVLNGQPFEGEHAGAGEIGHLVVDTDGPPCRCGHHGCLETYLARPSLAASMEAEGEAGIESIRRAAAEQLGVALATVVAILDLDHILVAGPREVLGDEFGDNATVSLRTRCLDSVAESVSVRFTPLGRDIVLLGATGVVLSQELGVA
ncbi:MAG: ROK family transcriptional regulator [Actinomycetia bacterium]|nr:ROK family transcriptional regulator [Actinomycetes bacterium]